MVVCSRLDDVAPQPPCPQEMSVGYRGMRIVPEGASPAPFHTATAKLAGRFWIHGGTQYEATASSTTSESRFQRGRVVDPAESETPNESGQWSVSTRRKWHNAVKTLRLGGSHTYYTNDF